MTPLLGVVLAASGCGAGSHGPRQRPSVWQPPLKQSVYLRAVYDDDPSLQLGRFVKVGTRATAMDESQAFASRCSAAFSPKLFGANGTFDEVLATGQQVAAGASVGAGAGAGAAAGGGTFGTASQLRVRYVLKGVMRAQVDAEALDKCCTAAPDQCSGEYLAEFYLGDGEVYQFVGSAAEVQARSGLPGSTGAPAATGSGADVPYSHGPAMLYSHGSVWRQVTRFQNVYFAYKTASVVGHGAGGGTDLCGGTWQQRVPQSLDGQYFVGLSKPAQTEQAAFDDALLHGRLQALQYIGSVIRQQRVQVSVDLDRALADQSVLTTATAGVARRVKDRCRGSVTDPDGRFLAKVLVFFPRPQIDAAAAELATQLQSVQRQFHDATLGLLWCGSVPAGACTADLRDRVRTLGQHGGLQMTDVVEVAHDPAIDAVRQAALQANASKGLVVRLDARHAGGDGVLHACFASASATLWDTEAGKTLHTAKPAGYGASGGYKGVVYADRAMPVDACRTALFKALAELDLLVSAWSVVPGVTP
ncbi:MAG: hypothetical protein EXR79_13405 [Myxococcales bacterium]|nr:hypothetical protein [Myxococcales bacterium]